MLKRCISAELMKLQHSHLWLILISLPVISMLIGCANYYLNRGVLTNGWYSLWTQVSLFYGQFFLPVLIAIVCAYICRLEHVNKNWNMVMTAPVSASGIFVSKLFVAAMLVSAVQLFFLVLYICAGKLLGMPQKFPPEVFGWMVRGLVASVSVSAVQLWLSTRIKSFAVPIGISVCAVFAGLGMYIAKFGMFFPYSLLTVGMGVISQEGLTISQSTMFYIMNLFFIVTACAIAINRLAKTDVKA